eukprot:747081-Pleurochrysis_carterae.AAC.3
MSQEHTVSNKRKSVPSPSQQQHELQPVDRANERWTTHTIARGLRQSVVALPLPRTRDVSPRAPGKFLSK